MSDTIPLKGNKSKYRPPAKIIISKIANRKDGTALPMMTTALDQISNFFPSLTAFEIPKGIDIK